MRVNIIEDEGKALGGEKRSEIRNRKKGLKQIHGIRRLLRIKVGFIPLDEKAFMNKIEFTFALIYSRHGRQTLNYKIMPSPSNKE